MSARPSAEWSLLDIEREGSDGGLLAHMPQVGEMMERVGEDMLARELARIAGADASGLIPPIAT